MIVGMLTITAALAVRLGSRGRGGIGEQAADPAQSAVVTSYLHALERHDRAAIKALHSAVPGTAQLDQLVDGHVEMFGGHRPHSVRIEYGSPAVPDVCPVRLHRTNQAVEIIYLVRRTDMTWALSLHEVGYDPATDVPPLQTPPPDEPSASREGNEPPSEFLPTR